MPTRDERLKAIILKYAPGLAGAVKSGDWGPRGAPYVITTTPDGGQNVRVTNTEGDSVGGSGSDLNAALAALEKKVGLPTGGA